MIGGRKTAKDIYGLGALFWGRKSISVGHENSRKAEHIRVQKRSRGKTLISLKPTRRKAPCLRRGTEKAHNRRSSGVSCALKEEGRGKKAKLSIGGGSRTGAKCHDPVGRKVENTSGGTIGRRTFCGIMD